MKYPVCLICLRHKLGEIVASRHEHEAGEADHGGIHSNTYTKIKREKINVICVFLENTGSVHSIVISMCPELIDFTGSHSWMYRVSHIPSPDQSL